MCGIVGLAGNFDLNLVGRLNQSIVHRGPDDRGEFLDQQSQVALAMRRLSILDLAGGHQPMSNEDGTVWIVFNGEIFNAPDLRQRLAPVHKFSTQNSDTEVIVHLYETYGEDVVKHLNGMFAFVIYDKTKQRLFGARDHTGIKPFYYLDAPGQFAFASELKALLQLPEFGRELNHQSLSHFLSLRYVPGEDTIFRNLKRLPAGHVFTYDLKASSLDIRRYWDLNFSPKPNISESEWEEKIYFELKTAAKRWMLSDVPIGCSLSGGIDSSALVGLLSEAGYDNLKTYSLGFAEPEAADLTEHNLARQVAEKWGTKHHELILTPDELLDDLVDMVWHLDEPYGGGLPSWYVYKFMRNDVVVGITGTGGDELFGNYAKYHLMESTGYIRSRVALSKSFGRDGWRSKRHYEYLKALKYAFAVQSSEAFQNPLNLYEHIYYSEKEKEAWVLQKEGSAGANTLDFLHRVSNPALDNPRDLVMHVDFKTQLPEEFLFVTDRFSMAHSLEARVPFLDRSFVDLVLGIPASQRTQPQSPKHLLRKAVGHLLPDDILKGGKKGFVLPLDLWLRGKLLKLVERFISEPYLKKQGLFNPAYVQHFVVPHLEGKANRGERIWPFLMFQLWYLIFVQERCTSKPSFKWQDIC